MILGIKNHKFQYEAEKLTRVFYPNEKITVVIGDSFQDGEALLLTEFTDSEVRVVFTDEAGSVLYSEENSLSGITDGELLMAQMMFRALVKITGYTPKWGILTGIRPSKLLRNLKATYGDEKGKEIFMHDYLVTKEKHFTFKTRVLQPLCFNSVLPDKVQLLFVCLPRNDKLAY